MINQAVERAVLLWLLRIGSTDSHGTDMEPVTSTDLSAFLNTGELVKPGQLTFSLYCYVGESEETRRAPSLTVICPSAQGIPDEPGNHLVEVEVELRMSSKSRPDAVDDPEADVIELIESSGRWLEESVTREASQMRDEINNGHEWCTVIIFTQSPNFQRFTDKQQRGARVTFQVRASLHNYRG